MEVMATLEQMPRRDHGHGCGHTAAGRRRARRITGILLIRALLQSQGNPRKKLLIPDSAHGTNPATAAMAGYTR